MLLSSLRLLIVSAFCSVSVTGFAADAEMDATTLAAKLSELRQDGQTDVRARMAIKGAGAEEILQLVIRSRRSAQGSDVHWQVIWPKERNQEGFVVRQSANGAASGFTRSAGGEVKKLTGADMQTLVLGSGLSYEDVVDNFYAWPDQKIVGSEKVGNADCLILESRPGGVRSSYDRVRSWVDARRMVPMQVEKYRKGALACRIDTERVVAESGRSLAANLLVRRPGLEKTTELDGSKIKRDQSFSDADFSEAALGAR